MAPVRSESNSAAELTRSVMTSFDNDKLTPAEWDAFVASADGDLYCSFDWCRIWWEHYGDGRDLRILVYRRGAEIIGLLPLVIDQLWLGPIPVRVARFAGSDSTMIVLNPAVRADSVQAVCTDALRFIFDECGCDLFYAGPLSGEHPHRVQIVAASTSLTDEVCVLHAGPCGVHTVVPLPEAPDDYLAGLSKSERGNYRRDQRNLTKDCGMQFDLVPPEEVEECFEEFAALHTEQWRAQGKLGHFGDWSKSLEFARALVRELAPSGRVRLSRLRADGQTVQLEFCIAFADTAHWRLPARRFSDRWERYGVGRVAMVERLRRAISDGIRRIEAGPGHYEYKLRLGGMEYPLESVLIAANRPLARIKGRLLRAISRLLNLLYYRIWFNRIAPRLPLPRRPLWKIWVRTRFQ